MVSAVKKIIIFKGFCSFAKDFELKGLLYLKRERLFFPDEISVLEQFKFRYTVKFSLPLCAFAGNKNKEYFPQRRKVAKPAKENLCKSEIYLFFFSRFFAFIGRQIFLLISNNIHFANLYFTEFSAFANARDAKIIVLSSSVFSFNLGDARNFFNFSFKPFAEFPFLKGAIIGIKNGSCGLFV